ncbi:glycoside hydrolase family 2 protein [Brachybacterium sp. AOP25-B2-12]|uniref:glycoside hydrolase family 2 protein n=1 Tax=Brachybacterium sp. AOP25-B2-12 TaxID=3457710 RepID=UPI0040334036
METDHDQHPDLASRPVAPAAHRALATLAARADALAAHLDPPLSAAGDVPRPEHPRPQLWRPTWLNLNGPWGFEIDRSDTGIERGLQDRPLEGTITVPFAPESADSGIEDTDVLEAVWYRRTVTIPADWSGLRPLLHFGAVDQDATVWADGVEVARHRGGFTPFTADLGGIVEPGGSVEIVVRARDPRDAPQARGKQATWFHNTHCHYTRTTGIWQTVWLEGVPEHAVRALRVLPNVAASSLGIDAALTANRPGTRVEVEASVPGGEVVATASVRADLDLSPHLELAIPAEHVRLWGAGAPELYALRVRLLDAEDAVLDEVHSYAGLRSVALDGRQLRINGEPVFQRLVLDQGYWPSSLMTAPSDAAIVDDVRIALEAGFNGARLHQKVFEERMLFWADVHGYLTWGEFGDWGVSGMGPIGHNQQPTASFVAQWLEAVRRDLNHPSIVGWCPLNETHQVLHDRITVLDDVTQAMYDATKLADPTRPVLDTSGYSHRVRGADVYDSHSYEQDPVRFAAEQSGLADGNPHTNRIDLPPNTMPHADGTFSIAYDGQPYFVSEYGGIWWNEEEARAAREAAAGGDTAVSWGYGQRVADEEDLYARFEALTRVLLEDPEMFGYCYTQLTDVFQEKNGVVDFARGRKLDLSRLRAVQERRAAYEGREG